MFETFTRRVRQFFSNILPAGTRARVSSEEINPNPHEELSSEETSVNQDPYSDRSLLSREFLSQVNKLTVGGNLSALKTLLKNKNIDLEVRDDAGNTALMLACKKRHFQLAETLLNAGADVNATHPTSGMTPMLISCSLGEPLLVQLLLTKKPNVDAINSSGMAAVHYAALQKNAPILQALIDAEANLNVLDIEGRAPIHYSVARGNLSCVQTLINSGKADVNIKCTSSQTTPLYDAVSFNLIRIAEALLDAAGIKVNSLNTVNNETPLFASKSKQMAELLINKGASTIATDKLNRTPLKKAILSSKSKNPHKSHLNKVEPFESILLDIAEGDSLDHFDSDSEKTVSEPNPNSNPYNAQAVQQNNLNNKNPNNTSLDR